MVRGGRVARPRTGPCGLRRDRERGSGLLGGVGVNGGEWWWDAGTVPPLCSEGAPCTYATRLNGLEGIAVPDLEFIHRFSDCSADGCLSIDARAPSEANLEVSVDSDGNVWLSANRAGWLHFARIAAELGTSQYEPGFHFHMRPDFRDWSSGQRPEVSLEIAE